MAEVKLVQIRKDVNKEWYYGGHVVDDTGKVQAGLIAGLERGPE